MSTSQIPPEAAALLEQMHGIEASPAIGWWPLALGWWLLLIASIVIIGGSFYLIRDYFRRNAYRRQALVLINQLQPNCSAEFATEVSTLLKRVALAAYPSQNSIIVKSHGEHWLNWLNQASQYDIFTDDSAIALTDAPYKADVTFDASHLHQCARRWIKNHAKKYPAHPTKGSATNV